MDTDTESQRVSHPEAFAVWQSGRVRPYWLSGTRERLGRTQADYEGAFGNGFAVRVEAGFMYPPWTFLCRYAAWLGCEVTALTAPTPPVSAPAVQTRSEEAEWESLFRFRYHPALVRATMLNLNDVYGIATVEAAIPTLNHALLTAGRAIGTQQVAGVTAEDVLEDLDAGRAPETRILRARWKTALTPIWDLITGDTAATGAGGAGTAGAEAVAWMDSSLRMTFIATREPDNMVLVSIAAHHDHHGRVPLPEGEADYWVPVLFSPTQLPGVTRRGTQSGHQLASDPIGVLTTEYFTYSPTTHE